ncbi:MAG: hypothetical protein ACRYFK_15725 [Janthinobacterium lividum]
MSKNWLWLLGSLGACGGPLQLTPEVALNHQHDAALQQQVQRLQAKQVKLSVAPAAAKGAPITVLNLEVLNPQDQLEHPDTLRQRVRKLAHLLAADLTQPDRYKVMNVQVVFRKGPFSPSTSIRLLSFIYPVAGLR